MFAHPWKSVNIDYYVGGKKNQNKSAKRNEKIIEHRKWYIIISQGEGSCFEC